MIIIDDSVIFAVLEKYGIQQDDEKPKETNEILPKTGERYGA